MSCINTFMLISSIICLLISLFIFVKSIYVAILRFIKTRDIQLKKAEYEKINNTLLEKGEQEKPDNTQLEKDEQEISNYSQFEKTQKNPYSKTKSNGINNNNFSYDIDNLFDSININITLVDCVSGNVLASIHKLPCIIGRGDGADVVIEYDKSISRRHVAFVYENGHLIVIDLQSANGTLINGSRISSKCEANNGDIMQIGQTKVKVIVNNER